MSIDREKILQAAQKHVDKKRFDKAIEEYEKLVRLDPNDARTLLKIGDLQTKMGALEAAIATYDRVGQHYASQGFALKAIAVYKQIRELIRKQAPELAERFAHVAPQLAEIYTQLGLTSDALVAWEEVATRHLRTGNERQAVEVFRKIVELDATNPLTHFRLAEALCRIQSLDEAVDEFGRAAELLIQLQRTDDALKVLHRVWEVKQIPRHAQVTAQLLLERGQLEDIKLALQRLQFAFQADPKDLDTLGLLAQAFSSMGQEEKAIEVYKEMAHIARAQDQAELFEQLVTHLQSVAPHDPTVHALAGGAPPSQHGSVLSVADAEVEAVEESAPAPMRPGQASAPDVVVVEEDYEVAEERQGPGSFDARAHARKALADAESFRRLRLLPKAVEVLQIALEIDPRSIEIRERLRVVLAEAGDLEGASGEAITLAAIALDDGDTQRAELLLYEVLDQEPDHPVALEMLHQLSTGAEGYTDEAETAEADVAAPLPPARGRLASLEDPFEGFEPEAPLPSYDLEDLGGQRAALAAVLARPVVTDSVDDPFAEESALPSFPLGEAPALEAEPLDLDEPPAAADAPAAWAAAPQEAWDYDEPAEAAAAPLPSFEVDAPELPTTEAVTAPQSVGSEAIEEVLDEAEFFAARGLYDDARAILDDAVARSPGHPLLLERLHELDELVAASGQSGTIDRGHLAMPSEPAPSDRAFDIAASLDALDQLGPPSAAASFSSVAQEVDVDQVFAKFKEGVRAQVAETDSSTHYDLGVAYKEMGLSADAIGEFDLAARDPARECMCFAMIGMIRLERGEIDLAGQAYIRALEARQKTVEQEMSLYYDLGVVHELQHKPADALYYFRKIARRDPGFRDVQDRIAALEPAKEVPAAPQGRTVNSDDEFDKVFDDLFE
ncbi:MAG: tetratricopeptide repeat protein [Polyangiaceae bacterium]|nr:tetratricopeptide repeat protein [Polyangiaceae bacterium]